MKRDIYKSTFRPDIEGLRGIAVLMVVAFHCGIPGFSGGFVGVDVFFVLSGYLITGLLVKEICTTSRLRLLQFYARRIRRLLPASTLTLLVTLSIGAVIFAPKEMLWSGRAARATALYASNVFFATKAANYFAPNVESNPLLHTWSLALEEQFYLFWPLLIMLSLQRLRSVKALLLLLFGLTIASMGASLWFTVHDITFAFYQLPTRAWEFGVGGIAALAPRGVPKVHSGYWLVLGWLGLVVILCSVHFISTGWGFPGWIALFPVIGTTSALVSGAALPARGVGVVFNSPPLQMLGTLSYSWYLWHWPFLVFSKALFPSITIVGMIAAGTASLVFAAVTHHAVENPIRYHSYLAERPFRSLYLFVGLTLLSLSASALSTRFASRMSESPEMKVFAMMDENPRLPFEECVAPAETLEVKVCVFGAEAAETNLVLFGDSHAMTWFNPLQRIAESNHWKLTTMVKAGCATANIKTRIGSPSCASWRAEAIRRIIALRPSAVFIANGSWYLPRADRPTAYRPVPLDDWRDGTRLTLKSLADVGLQVVVMRDNPAFAFDIPTCLARSIRLSWRPSGSCEMSRSAVLNPSIFEAERSAAQDLQTVHLIDMTDQYCGRDICWVVRDGLIMYFDDNHLSSRFTDSLASVLAGRLIPLLDTPR